MSFDRDNDDCREHDDSSECWSSYGFPYDPYADMEEDDRDDERHNDESGGDE